MNIFSKLGSFAKTVESEFAKLWGQVPSKMQVAKQGVAYIQPLVVLLFGLFDPSDAAEAADVMNETKGALATVSSIASLSSPGATDIQTAQNALNAAKTNLVGMLNAAQVKNPANLAKITATGNAVIDELNAMLESLAANQVPAAA
jgi:hypothetical protein